MVFRKSKALSAACARPISPQSSRAARGDGATRPRRQLERRRGRGMEALEAARPTSHGKHAEGARQDARAGRGAALGQGPAWGRDSGAAAAAAIEWWRGRGEARFREGEACCGKARAARRRASEPRLSRRPTTSASGRVAPRRKDGYDTNMTGRGGPWPRASTTSRHRQYRKLKETPSPGKRSRATTTRRQDYFQRWMKDRTVSADTRHAFFHPSSCAARAPLVSRALPSAAA